MVCYKNFFLTIIVSLASSSFGLKQQISVFSLIMQFAGVGTTIYEGIVGHNEVAPLPHLVPGKPMNLYHLLWLSFPKWMSIVMDYTETH